MRWQCLKNYSSNAIFPKLPLDLYCHVVAGVVKSHCLFRFQATTTLKPTKNPKNFSGRNEVAGTSGNGAAAVGNNDSVDVGGHDGDDTGGNDDAEVGGSEAADVSGHDGIDVGGSDGVDNDGGCNDGLDVGGSDGAVAGDHTVADDDANASADVHDGYYGLRDSNGADANSNDGTGDNDNGAVNVDNNESENACDIPSDAHGNDSAHTDGNDSVQTSDNRDGVTAAGGANSDDLVEVTKVITNSSGEVIIKFVFL